MEAHEAAEVHTMSSSSNDDVPWYLDTLPGRTGTFLGHFLAAYCTAGLGVSQLLLALYRARNLPIGKGFSEMHIPERNLVLLSRFGWLMFVGASSGIILEIVDKDPGYDSAALIHSALYGPYFVIGVCALWESQGRLPLDTHRVAWGMTYALHAIIWFGHASMKNLMVDRILHFVMCAIVVSNLIVLWYSVRHPDSIVAFLGSHGILIMQGIWLTQIGLYECCIDLDVNDVYGYFVFYCLGIFLVVGAGFVYGVPSNPGTVGDQEDQPVVGSAEEVVGLCSEHEICDY